ncbi:MAG: hypothetical protein U0401_12630 [Anaerolineae bacterium]
MVDEAGKLVGIITESDIFRMVVQQWSQMLKQVCSNKKGGHSRLFCIL